MTNTVRGPAGVSAGHPLATAAGLRILRRGGSAVDSALAAAFTQWVVSSPLCGPGGDLLLLVARGDDVTVYGGWSRVPLAIDRDADIATYGPKAAVVPGALLGAEAAWRQRGRLAWHDLFEDALTAAAGHVVTAWMANAYGEVVRRGHSDALQRVVGRLDAPREGERVDTRALRQSLEEIAHSGSAALYSGSLGRRMVAAGVQAGAWLGHDDFDRAGAIVEEAQAYRCADLTVYLPPWPSQASIVADLVGAVSPDEDPLSQAYVERIAPLTEERLVRRCTAGLAGTAVSAAADSDGTVALVVHSLAGTQYGTGWVAGDTGVALGNRVGTALTRRADLPAANPVPGGLIPHTLSAAFAVRAGLAMAVATPGGDRQVQWLAQAIQRFRRGATADETANGPRWFVCPEGDRFGVPSGIGQPWYVFSEAHSNWSTAVRVAGYPIRRVDNVGGGLQVLYRHDDAWELASDWRSGGSAVALEETSCT